MVLLHNRHHMLIIDNNKVNLEMLDNKSTFNNINNQFLSNRIEVNQPKK